MNKFTKLAMAGAFGLIAATSLAGAQQQKEPQFDWQKFWEQLDKSGAADKKTIKPNGFDGNKFWERIESNGASSKNPVTPSAFFAELAKSGVQMKPGFDGDKFWADLEKGGAKTSLIKGAKK